MSAFQRTQRRFDCLGVQLTRAADNCASGKWPILENVRSVIQGTIQAREGLQAVSGASFGSPIHSIARFDDATPFAGSANLYFIGASTSIYSGDLNGPFPSVDSGYSGSPLSWVSATPPQAPQPWLYVADPNRMRKFDANGHVFRPGIAPPLAEPVARLQKLGVNVIEQFEGAFVPWVAVGGATPAPTTGLRVNTSINEILFDVGTENSYASVYPGTMAGLDEGMLVTFGGAEVVAITQLTMAIAPTTVEAIQYDSGSTGMCTVQPAGSLGVGQLDAPSLQDYQTRYGVNYAVPRGTAQGGTGTGLPPALTSVPRARIRQVDFPVNCSVRIDSELVRIQSVAVGKDGVQSFRCLCLATHGPGAPIVGAAGFRAFVVGAWPGATTITDGTLTNILTPIAPSPNPDDLPAQITGGVRTGPGWATRNLAQINGRATLPEDDIRLSIRANLFTEVQTVRLYFSMEPTAGATPATTDFTSNYFFFEWRQSDIATAIQSVNATPVAPLSQARAIAQSNAITDRPTEYVANGAPTPADTRIIFTRAGRVAVNDPIQTNTGANAYSRRNPGGAIANDALSQQLALGNNQWLELHCKVKDLTHVGTDPSRTLANVTAAEILLDVKGEEPVTVDYDALWLSGGYSPDVGSLGTPYVYCYRYRSSLTGGRSNPSPAVRGGIMPRRQRTIVTGVQSADPQVDRIDWFRIGGALDRWTYVGSTANTATPSFTDVYDDASIDGGEGLDVNLFPPFPTQDIPHTGFCNVAGSSITWVSGDLFDTNWMPGSLILVNGQAYSLYSQPTSTSRLFLNENAGSGAGVPFTLVGPTLINQNYGSVWGGPIGGATFLFACRDPINPGFIHWSNGNDTETSSDKNLLQVSDANEPLQAGFMWDGVAFVASTENLFALEPTFGSPSTFRALITPCGRGFWTPWAWCIAPEGVYFVAKDGIFLTSGGSAARSITEDDLAPLFPHNGLYGQAVNGYSPIAMGALTVGATGEVCADFDCEGPTLYPDLRLAYIDGWVIFDYMDIFGERRSLSYHVASKGWFPDRYTPGINMRTAGVGETVHEELCGGVDGQLFIAGSPTDDGTPIACVAQFVDNQGDARRYKLYRDLYLKANLAGAVAQVKLGLTDNTNLLPPSILTGAPVSQNYVIDTVPTTGIFGSNLTINLQWSPASVIGPIWEVADIAFQQAPELASSWLSGPTTHNLSGYQQVPRALIAYMATGAVTLSVVIDNVTYTYNLPSTNGLVAKHQVVLQSAKGKFFQWGMQGSPFLLFDREIEVWCQQWGAGGGYSIQRPF